MKRWLILVVLLQGACGRTEDEEPQKMEGSAIDCTGDPALRLEPSLFGESIGVDGAEVDRCDDSGNLLEAECEVLETCTPTFNPVCEQNFTGKVEMVSVDCGGECQDGLCASECPKAGDRATVSSSEGGGDVVLRMETDGREYACVLSFDQSGDDFDCSADVEKGQNLTLTASGSSETHCASGMFNVATAACTYVCSRLPR